MISSCSLTIRSLFSSRLTFTMSNAELRSMLAMIVYLFESSALAISDWISSSAVLVLLLIFKTNGVTIYKPPKKIIEL